MAVERILVVDDEEPIREIVCSMLSASKYSCHQAASGLEALALLESCGIGSQVTILRTEYPHRDLSIIDVLNPNCSKGQAVARWAKHRGIPREQVMAIGDNYNDIEMLAFAGQPFIMGNASSDLKARGWRVTLSNDESGVAAALETVLGKQDSHIVKQQQF